MQIGRCPVCHSRVALEQVTQDEAARELLGLLSKMDTQTGAALTGYLGLFRSANRDLANDRALRLAKEVLGLSDQARVAIALGETVEALRSKEMTKPLANHNYLKRVLESVEARPVAITATNKAVAPKSKTGQAFMALESLKNGG